MSDLIGRVLIDLELTDLPVFLIRAKHPDVVIREVEDGMFKLINKRDVTDFLLVSKRRDILLRLKQEQKPALHVGRIMFGKKRMEEV